MSLPPAPRLLKSGPWMTSLLAASLLLLASFPARADLVLSVQSVNSSAGAFDVSLTNTGSAATNFDSFSFEVNVTSANVSFNNATTGTTVAPYAFAGHSLFGPDITTSVTNTGSMSTLDASDIYDTVGGSATLGAHASLSLGHVFFTTAGHFTSPVAVTLSAFPATGLSLGNTNVPITTLNSGTISPVISSVPEPSTPVLALALVSAAAWLRRRSRRASSAVSTA